MCALQACLTTLQVGIGPITVLQRPGLLHPSHPSFASKSDQQSDRSDPSQPIKVVGRPSGPAVCHWHPSWQGPTPSTCTTRSSTVLCLCDVTGRPGQGLAGHAALAPGSRRTQQTQLRRASATPNRVSLLVRSDTDVHLPSLGHSPRPPESPGPPSLGFPVTLGQLAVCAVGAPEGNPGDAWQTHPSPGSLRSLHDCRPNIAPGHAGFCASRSLHRPPA
jgi:hypothetical protein